MRERHGGVCSGKGRGRGVRREEVVLNNAPEQRCKTRATIVAMNGEV